MFAAIAVVVGAATHVAWDAFTHANTPVAEMFPALHAEVFRFHGRPIRMYFVLQCLSSLVGMLALAIWAFRLRRAAPRCRAANESQPPSPRSRARVAALAIVIAVSGSRPC